MSPPERIRVVYFGHVATLSGAEIALLRLLPALLDHVDPLVVLAEDGPLVEQLRSAGVETRVVPLGNRVRDRRRDAGTRLSLRDAIALMRYINTLRRLLRQERPALVHTNTLKAALYGAVAGRLANVPVVWHVRDRIAPDYLPKPVVALVHAAGHILPSGMVANSKSTLASVPNRRTLLRRRIPAAVAYEGVRPPPTAGAKPHAPERSLQIGMLGRLSPWKGQALFLRAFAEAFGGTSARAILIGSAMFGEHHYVETLHELAQELGIAAQTDFRGFQRDVWSELAGLDLLVHYSVIPEPFGQVVVEGMASGLCVLAAAEGGPSEIVTDGIDGVLVTPRDPHALAAALTRCSGDAELRLRLGHAGQLRARDFRPEVAAEAVLAVYRQIVPSAERDVHPRTG